ncbi:type II toxin-antitoxin system VapC family toxin [Luteipulveratus flavus]|uniref:Ribonuclease VapC n=1 Tax=Luteipulveratus flavus TaxID=3031728 RepID=A0ABT6CB48_9MICO|nr:type II toxin-antitoxin system VapC family toxin [Luteipulveratus sp. YIM 133296]MDF8266120.1 type II toxin-antitoxin system VapC family toxin [Luteipulveratus sp. YIM 133296]
MVAILNAEPGWQVLEEALRSAPSPKMSAATYVELGAVVDSRRDPSLSRRVDQLLDAWGVTVVAVTPADADVARAAYRDFGRGSGHSARLNYGDCFAYALARSSREPLLFVGDDFGHTDVEVVALDA